MHDRWFSWPWRPWVKTWIYTPRIPDQNIYRIPDLVGGEILIMHPDVFSKLRPDGY